MAFDYTTANSGTFVRAGKFLKYINTRLTRATTDLPAELTAIVAQAEAADLLLPQEGIATLYEDFKRTVTTERQQLAAYIDRIFTDRDTVLEQLRVPVADLNAVLTALLQDMTDNSREVKSCTVTLGPIVVSGSNVGTGRVLTTKVLDGYNPPLQGAMSHIRYTGLNSELAVTSETMELTCTADNPRDGVSEGSERFEWKGGVPIEKLDWQDEGSGLGPTITVANGAGLLTDGDLENWGSTGNNTPSVNRPAPLATVIVGPWPEPSSCQSSFSMGTPPFHSKRSLPSLTPSRGLSAVQANSMVSLVTANSELRPV